jgi:glucuronoarabinoxylan endo-1,4-beta-xylanase
LALALDTTANPGGVPAQATFAGDANVAGPDFIPLVFSTAGGGRRAYVFYEIVARGNAVTAVAPFSVFWSDSSGNVVAAPSGASAWQSVEVKAWGSPYANFGEIGCYYADLGSAVTSARVAVKRATANTGAQDRIGGAIQLYVPFDTAGGAIATGAHTSMQDVADPPTEPQIAMRLGVSVQAAGSWLLTAWHCDFVNTALVGDTGRAAEAGESATHGTKIEANFEDTVGNAMMAGRLASSNSGSVLATTGAGTVTVGCNKSDNYVMGLAVEVMIAPAGLAGSSSGATSASGSLSSSVKLAGSSSGATSASGALSLPGSMAGSSTGRTDVRGALGPSITPAQQVVVASGTQLFVASGSPTWSVVEGGGGSIAAGTGNNATYTAPATPGTYHVQAIVGGITVKATVNVIAAPSNPTVRLDNALQVMDGFGAAQGDSEPTTITDSLADLLYDPNVGIGLSIFRIGINPDGTPRHDPDDFTAFGGWDLYGHAHQALARNPALRIIAAPWTPPVAYKDNGALIGGHLNSANYADWAAVLAGFVATAKAQTPSVPIYALSAQNEPDFGTGHDSCLYSAAQLRDFVKVLGAAIAGLNPRPLLCAPEPSQPTQLETYLSTLEADSLALAYTDVYTTHQYANATMPGPTRAARRVWQTEMSGLAGGPEATWDPSITDGIAVALWIHSAITAGGVTAWCWWWAINEGGSGSPPQNTDNEALIVTGTAGDIIASPTLTKRLYTLGNFSKFVRPGFVRHSIVGSLPANVSASAYRDPASGQVVVVAINNSGSTANLNLAVAGGTAPVAMTPYVTSGTSIGAIGSAGNLEKKTPINLSGGVLSATLAANSVTSFVSGTDMTGSASGGTTAAGALSASVALAGSASGSTTGSANLSAKVSLAGSVSSASTASGALSAAVRLAGSSSGSSSASALLSALAALAGASSGLSTASGALSASGGSSSLSGSSSGSTSASGALAAAVFLAGSSSGSTSASGALASAAGSVTRQLVGIQPGFYVVDGIQPGFYVIDTGG